jgi:hypothetical protein
MGYTHSLKRTYTIGSLSLGYNFFSENLDAAEANEFLLLLVLSVAFL